MSGYVKPKKKLHREFLYLNHDTVLNALSAFEAGKVDEIIQKASEAREGGLEGSLGYGPVKASGGRKKTANIEEELTRTRTIFSAFEAWYTHLDEEKAFGELTGWDEETRDELGVGDTITFRARVSLSPIQQVFLTFIAFAAESTNPNSALKQPTAQAAQMKKTASMIAGWLRGSNGATNIQVYVAPLGIDEPRMAARLDERYLVGGTQAVEGEFTVVGQIESLIELGKPVPAMRLLRDTPPTPLETDTINNALSNMIEGAAGLGLDVSSNDLTLKNPGVILHPIAIFR